MADHGTPEHIDELKRVVVAAHLTLRAMLSTLPLPIVLPDLDMGDEDMPVVLLATDRARTLIQDQPISELRKMALTGMVLNWFVAFDLLCVHTSLGPAPWRLPAVEHAIRDFLAYAEGLHDGDFDED